MHRIKCHFLNALLDETVQRSTSQDKCSFVQTLQASITNFSCWHFSVSDFGVLKAYVFAKDRSQEKAGWKDLNYHTSETGISSCFLSLHQYKQIHRKLVLCVRKIGIQTLQKCVFFMFIHMWNVDKGNRTFVAAYSLRNDFFSQNSFINFAPNTGIPLQHGGRRGCLSSLPPLLLGEHFLLVMEETTHEG